MGCKKIKNDKRCFLLNQNGKNEGRVPENLQKNLLACYSAQSYGRADVAVNMTNAVTNGDASGGTAGWTPQNLSGFSVLNGKFKWTATAQNGSQSQSISTVVGRKYQAIAKVTATSSLVRLFMSGTNASHPGDGTERILTLQFTATSTAHNVGVLDIASSGWAQVTVDEIMVIDLSTPFGLSNEPTATEFADMLTYKGKTFWNGTEPVVINPNDKYYWPDRSGNNRHLHLVNLAYDATGGLQAGPPANYLFDGVNDYAVYNSATDIVAANGAVSAFVVFQAKDTVGATHRLVSLSPSTSANTLVSYAAPTAIVASGSNGAIAAPSSITVSADKWFSHYSHYNPSTQKMGSAANGGTLSEGASTAVNNAVKIIALAARYDYTAFNNDRIAEVYLFNKVLSQAEIKALHNNIASRYPGLTKV